MIVEIPCAEQRRRYWCWILDQQSSDPRNQLTMSRAEAKSVILERTNLRADVSEEKRISFFDALERAPDAVLIVQANYLLNKFDEQNHPKY